MHIVDPTFTFGLLLALKPTPFIVNIYPPIAAFSIVVILNSIILTHILSA